MRRLSGHLGHLLLICNVASAQMAGSYSIDPRGSGTRNFRSFAAAMQSVGGAGISAPVVFWVAPGVHRESWSVPAVNGAGPGVTVTIKGLSLPRVFYLSQLFGGAGSIVTIQPGAHDVVIDGLDFVGTSTGHAISAYANRSVNVRQPIDRIWIRNCRFQNGIAGAYGRGHIHVEGRSISSGWTVENCLFQMLAYGYGIGMGELGRSSVVGNRFELSGTKCALFWNNLNDGRNTVCNNVFTGHTSNDPDACAIDVAAANMSNDVCFNSVRITTGGAAIRTWGTGQYYNRIYSNVLAVQGSGVGLWVTSSPYPDYWVSDGNLFHVASGDVGRIRDARIRGIGAWQAATARKPLGPQDGNSLEGDPRFAPGGELELLPVSPGIGRAIVVPGRYGPFEDIDGWQRGPIQDIGAHEVAGHRSYGNGCAGGNGVPEAHVEGNVWPGHVLVIGVRRAKPGAGVLLSVGTQKAAINLGAGACTLLHYPSVVTMLLRASSGGSAETRTTVPSNAAVQGASAFLQFGVDDQKSAVGVALSAGVEIRL